MNAYLGGFVAGERIENETRTSVAPWISVGVEGGLGDRDIGPFRSIGLYIQALDLGALGSYRLNSQTAEAEPNVSLKNVFSPGAYVTLAFNKAPISLALGLSYSPELRKIKSATEQVQTASTLRVGLAFGIDVPIFP